MWYFSNRASWTFEIEIISDELIVDAEHAAGGQRRRRVRARAPLAPHCPYFPYKTMMIFSVSEPAPKEESTNNCFRKTRRFLQISMLMSGYPSHLTPFAGLVPSLLNPVGGITPSSPFQQLPPTQQQMEKLAGKHKFENSPCWFHHFFNFQHFTVLTLF